MRRIVALALLSVVALAGTAHAQDTFQAQVRFAQVGDQRIAWYERGSGAPLVMAIGTGSTMSEWDPALLRLLARDHRLILFDPPGIGRSSKLIGGQTSFAGLADTTAAFMDAIGVPQADVLGWSMGGFVMQQLAVRHPDHVRRMILAGTNPGGEHAVLGDADDQQGDSDPDPSMAQVLNILYPRTDAGRREGRAFYRRLDRASESGEIPDDFVVPAATVRAQVAAEDPWLRSDANGEALARLTMPVLVTAGEVDPVTPPANARWIAAQIPGAQLQLFPGAHAFLFGDRVAFTARVDAFLG